MYHVQTLQDITKLPLTLRTPNPCESKVGAEFTKKRKPLKQMLFPWFKESLLSFVLHFCFSLQKPDKRTNLTCSELGST